MTAPIRPFVRGLYLCDYVIGGEIGKTDLYGVFNAIRPEAYPHIQKRFCVFAQLSGGLGDVPFFIDVLFRSRNELVRTTEVRQLHFPNREMLVQLVLEIEGCPFPEPGSYLLELHCDNACVADVPLQLLEKETEDERDETNGRQ